MASLNPSTAGESFLRQFGEATLPETLFRAYARHLLRSSDAWGLPVSLERIRERYGFTRREARMPQRGFLLGDAIFVNSDDPGTVQRFTEAHEMMEALVAALRAAGLAHLASIDPESFERDKERWCEYGAAQLLMPDELFSPYVNEAGVSLQAARHLAQLCRTSLTATLRQMLAVDLTPTIFALLRAGHKKSEFIPSKAGQGVLWGKPEDWDPPAELRVWRRWSSPQTDRFLCLNESFARDGLVQQAFRARDFGRIYQGSEELDLEYIQGVHPLEAMLVSIDGTPVVMALLHLS